MKESVGARLLDDVARLMTDAVGAAQGARREIESVFRAQLERIAREMDFVPREEFEAVREMALLAREENDRLSARLDALEQGLGGDKA
jgi:BMFP domain-containing protein YqiC